MKKIIIIVLVVVFSHSVSAEILINEFVTSSDSDWVEIFLKGDGCRIDISSLYVTMYYGKNEPLANEKVTLCSTNLKITSYDDRFAIIHLNSPEKKDETDRTGDLNNNGVLDLYCSNYFGSLWNTDGVVAIDTDDSPDNGGIFDFVAYSNRDGSPSEVITSYIRSASMFGMWDEIRNSPQEICVFIGSSGLGYGMSVSRRNSSDTNKQDDFSVTKFSTPGKENIFSLNQKRRKLFRSLRKKILYRKGHRFAPSKIELQVYEVCNIRFRIFSSAGLQVCKSGAFNSVLPGNRKLPLDHRVFKTTGLYICCIDASSSRIKTGESEVVFIIFTR